MAANQNTALKLIILEFAGVKRIELDVLQIRERILELEWGIRYGAEMGEVEIGSVHSILEHGPVNLLVEPSGTS